MQRDSAPRPKPEMGVLIGTRPRPTYQLNCKEPLLSNVFYPKSNIKYIPGGYCLRWSISRWTSSGLSVDVVQRRQIDAVIFLGDSPNCSITINQLRNSRPDDILDADYLVEVCDSFTQSAYLQADATRTALMAFEDRDCLLPHEISTEISELLITESLKGKKIWGTAIEYLVERLTRGAFHPGVCVLQAQPLEEIWRLGDLRSRHLDAGQKYLTNDREIQLAARRRNAMEKLYSKTLGFVPIGHQWLAKNLG